MILSLPSLIDKDLKNLSILSTEFFEEGRFMTSGLINIASGFDRCTSGTSARFFDWEKFTLVILVTFYFFTKHGENRFVYKCFYQIGNGAIGVPFLSARITSLESPSFK